MLAPEFLPNWGGVGTYIVELIKHLPEDFEVIVITPDRGEVDANYLHDHLKVIRTSKAGDTFIYNLKFQYSCLKKVPELVKKEEIDVIHSHTAHMPDLLLSFKELNIPVVTTVHSTIKLQRRGTKMSTSFWNAEFSEKMTCLLYPFLRLAEEFYFSRGRKYITVSKWMKNYLKQEYNLDGVKVIYNSVDTDFFYKRKDFEFIAPEGYKNREVILYCGRLIGLKGVGILIKSMKEVIKKHGDALFLFAGRGNQSYFERLLRDLEIPRKNYEFLGHVDYNRLVEYYSISDVFVLPSFHENLPTSLLEAMACEVPCIATDVGGVPEIIKDGENGILLNAGDMKGLADAINNALGNPEEFRRIGIKSRENVVKNFSWGGNIKEIARLYKEVSVK